MKYAAQFTSAGFPSACIEAGTPKQERARSIAGFKAGKLRMLTNVFVLTEGVDVPAAEVCILARNPGHASTYLQMVGRVLRPAPGKSHGLLIDLCGSSWKHGLPGSDLEYSLEGKAIRVAGSDDERDEDGDDERDGPPAVKVWNRALQEVYAGEDTPSDAKAAEWERLRAFAARRQWDIGWAVKEYRKLFKSSPPDLGADGDAQMRASFRQLQSRGRAAGNKPGWAAVMFKARFGSWPPRAWWSA